MALVKELLTDALQDLLHAETQLTAALINVLINNGAATRVPKFSPAG